MRRGQTRPLSIAPMMERTDRHFRRVLRELTRETLLYTEMVTTGALLRGDPGRHLDFSPVERPLALQLGGDDPEALAACARMAEGWGYDEVNLNIGCPSPRVQSGNFGVCLMGDPARVAEAVARMRAAVALPVTVKCRIGFDDRDRYEDLLAFVDAVDAAGVDRVTVHARKAWLSGLSPRENREIPPLRYEEVRRLKAERPHLVVELNGGVRTLDDAAAERARGVDAVMIGRAAWDDPMMLAEADALLFGAPARPAPSPAEVVEALLPYVAERTAAGDGLHHLTRGLHGLATGRPGARRWRRALTGLGRPTGAEAARALRGTLAALDPARAEGERLNR